MTTTGTVGADASRRFARSDAASAALSALAAGADAALFIATLVASAAFIIGGALVALPVALAGWIADVPLGRHPAAWTPIGRPGEAS